MTRAIEVTARLVPDEAIAGSEKVQAALTKTSAVLVALQGEGKKVNQSLVAGFVADAQQAGYSADKIKSELTNTFQVSESAAEQLGRTYGSTSQKMVEDTTKIGSKTSGLADNIKGNLAGAFSGFDGTATGALESVGSSLGSLAALIPGVGGLIGGVLGSLIGGAFKGIGDDAEKSKQRVSDAFDDMIASGNRFVSAEFFNKAIKDILNDDGQVAAAKKYADSLNLPLATVVSALAGVPGAIDDVNSQVAAKTAVLAQKLDDAGGRAKSVIISNGQQESSWKELTDKIQGTTDGYSKAADKASLVSQASDIVTSSTKTAASGVAGLGQALDELPASKSVAVTVDTSAAEAALARLANKPLKLTADIKSVQVRGGKALL